MCTSPTSRQPARSRRCAARAAEGVKVTCEVTPHHIALADEHVQSFSTNLKMNPPLGGRASPGASGRHRRRDGRRHRHRSRPASLRREERGVRSGAVRHHRPGDGVRRLLRPARLREGDQPAASHRPVHLGPGAACSTCRAARSAQGALGDVTLIDLDDRYQVTSAFAPRPRTRRSSVRRCTGRVVTTSSAATSVTTPRGEEAAGPEEEMTTEADRDRRRLAAYCDLWSNFITERYPTSRRSRPTPIPTTPCRRSTTRSTCSSSTWRCRAWTARSSSTTRGKGLPSAASSSPPPHPADELHQRFRIGETIAVINKTEPSSRRRS